MRIHFLFFWLKAAKPAIETLVPDEAWFLFVNTSLVDHTGPIFPWERERSTCAEIYTERQEPHTSFHHGAGIH